jgi:hypothetical protein
MSSSSWLANGRYCSRLTLGSPGQSRGCRAYCAPSACQLSQASHHLGLPDQMNVDAQSASPIIYMRLQTQECYHPDGTGMGTDNPCQLPIWSEALSQHICEQTGSLRRSATQPVARRLQMMTGHAGSIVPTGRLSSAELEPTAAQLSWARCCCQPDSEVRPALQHIGG